MNLQCSLRPKKKGQPYPLKSSNTTIKYNLQTKNYLLLCLFKLIANCMKAIKGCLKGTDEKKKSNKLLSKNKLISNELNETITINAK